MSTFFYALLSGMFVTFIFDFFIVLGLKLNYIDVYEIDVYYNAFFADTQNIWIFGAGTLFFGYFTIYSKCVKCNVLILATSFLLSLSVLLEDVGTLLGEQVFMQRDVVLQDKKYTYRGDVIYAGRKEITFFDHELQKIITLHKKDLNP
ncbi:MAG: hypothetical protein AB7D43_03370 [Sulfurimonadaceae bacterium]